jgi:hypothetical protein
MGVHGSGSRAGSTSQGLLSIIVFMKMSMPLMQLLRGPMTVVIGSAPGGVDDQPVVGMRNAVGLKPYIPQAAAGTRMLPILPHVMLATALRR